VVVGLAWLCEPLEDDGVVLVGCVLVGWVLVVEVWCFFGFATGFGDAANATATVVPPGSEPCAWMS
jgi:hypothetical protein